MTRDEMRAILEALSAREPDLKVKGKKMPYLSMNGNMFAFVDPEGALCLRLAEDDRVRHAETFGTGPVMQYGAVMRGYVAVPDAVAVDKARVGGLFSQAVEYARTLKPKPTRRS